MASDTPDPRGRREALRFRGLGMESSQDPVQTPRSLEVRGWRDPWKLPQITPWNRCPGPAAPTEVPVPHHGFSGRSDHDQDFLSCSPRRPDTCSADPEASAVMEKDVSWKKLAPVEVFHNVQMFGLVTLVDRICLLFVLFVCFFVCLFFVRTMCVCVFFFFFSSCGPTFQSSFRSRRDFFFSACI